MSTKHRHGLALGILLAATCAACSGEDVHFNVKNAPEFTQGARAISVFGVFRDGQMNPAAWNEIEAEFSRVLGKSACDVGFGEKLQEAKPELFTTTEDTARSEGVTDDLLGQFAPMASGDVIMVVNVHGRTHNPDTDAKSAPSGTAMAQSMGGGGRGRGGRGVGPPPVARPLADNLEISASFFSVHDRRVLARTTMTYAGPSYENAVKMFVTKLQTEIPGATCSGWNWKAQ